MTNYICDPQKNFVKDAQYTEQTLRNDISQSLATKQCMDKARSSGKDFFVQQRKNGQTICGIFNNKLDSESEYVQHGHIYGTVCHEPGRVFTYKADEDRLKHSLVNFFR